MICVAQDAEGLKIAALELMEESFDAPERERIEKMAENAANAEALRASIPNRRTLSPGYYVWLNSIMESVVIPMEAGIQFSSGDLDVEEFIAIRAIRDAKAEFRELHPPCRGCGRPLQEHGAKLCAGCEHEKFMAEARSR